MAQKPNSLSSDRLESRRVIVIDDNEAIHTDFEKILSPAKAKPELDAAQAAFFGASWFVAKVVTIIFHRYIMDFLRHDLAGNS